MTKTATDTIFDFSVRSIGNKDVLLSDYKGRVLIIVNTASKCGLTPQYEQLEKLYKTYKDRGLVVLGFPCNQFGGQEPEGEEKIAEFCTVNYGVSFPMFAKIDVNGNTAHPLYRFLKSTKPGLLGTEPIKWNFTKFLVGRDGHVVGRYAPMTTPESMMADVEALL